MVRGAKETEGKGGMEPSLQSRECVMEVPAGGEGRAEDVRRER